MSSELSPGALLADRYRVDRLVGSGGMANVWAARDETTDRLVAIKQLHASLQGRDDLRKRFLAEAQLSNSVDHPAVVPMTALFELSDHSLVIVMDLLEGETLAALLARREALEVSEALGVLTPVASALAAAHARGIVHRDLKPQNIFLARTADSSAAPKVLDFGIAKLLDRAPGASVLTKAGVALGTPCYMAPEQAAAEPTIDGRADVWALGVVTYECLAGARPLEVTSVGHLLKRLATEAITPLDALVPDAPRELTALVATMLTADRDQRPGDMAAIAATYARLGGVA